MDCYFIAAVLGYIILRRIGKVQLRFSFNAQEVMKIARQSFPYALLIFLMSIYNRADAMMIERLCTDGKDQAGIWAAAFRLLDMANILGLMFATMLLPMFGRMLAQKTDVQPIIKLCVNMLLPFSFMVAVAGYFFGDDIMYMLYHKSQLYYQHSLSYTAVFSILMASFPAWCLMYVYSTLLTSNGSLKTLNSIAFFGVIINLGLNFMLIPRYGAIGGALVSFLTQTVATVRIIKLRINIRWTLAQLGYLLFVIAVGIGVSHFPSLDWKLRLGALGLLSVAFMFVFRFVSVSAIRQFAKSKQ
jgi:O-antigen/teichoic acid export membrane protein